jgi:hypothetical protein
LLLDARRALAAVTARRRTRCFFVFTLGGTRPLKVPNVHSVYRQISVERTFVLKPTRVLAGRFSSRCEARSQTGAPNPGADLKQAFVAGA